MKKHLKTGAQIVTVLAALVIMITAVHAYTNPTGSAPSGNVPAPVNTGTTMQTKEGDLGLGGVGTGNLFATMNGWFGGTVFANNGVFMPGAATTFTASTDLLFASKVLSPLTGLSVDANGNTTIGGPLAITSGSPAAGDVLTSDASGNATWQPSAAAAPTIGSISTGSLITYVEANAGPNVAQVTANCPSGYQVIGGGGYCDSQATLNVSLPNVNTVNNQPDAGWYTACIGSPLTAASQMTTSAAHATAICMQMTNLATAPGSGSTGSGSTGSGSWHILPHATGTSAQTCTAWLATQGITVGPTGPSGGINVRAVASGVGYPGDCAYVTSGGVGSYRSTGYSVSGTSPTSSATGSSGPITTEVYY